MARSSGAAVAWNAGSARQPVTWASRRVRASWSWMSSARRVCAACWSVGWSDMHVSFLHAPLWCSCKRTVIMIVLGELFAALLGHHKNHLSLLPDSERHRADQRATLAAQSGPC